jgi:hypothetical protein
VGGAELQRRYVRCGYGDDGHDMLPDLCDDSHGKPGREAQLLSAVQFFVWSVDVGCVVGGEDGVAWVRWFHKWHSDTYHGGGGRDVDADSTDNWRYQRIFPPDQWKWNYDVGGWSFCGWIKWTGAV